jgi:hypothetical protein
VGLGPFRSEFYTNPAQNAFELGAVSWMDNLALHEFRHVQQYSNFNKGLSKAATFLFGEQGQLLRMPYLFPIGSSKEMRYSMKQIYATGKGGIAIVPLKLSITFCCQQEI